jgi:GxxExxY protein
LAYKGRPIGIHRLDLLVERTVVVEVKSVERLSPVFEAQLLAYLRVARKRVGLLLNFNSDLMKHGIRRLILG